MFVSKLLAWCVCFSVVILFLYLLFAFSLVLSKTAYRNHQKIVVFCAFSCSPPEHIVHKRIFAFLKIYIIENNMVSVSVYSTWLCFSEQTTTTTTMTKPSKKNRKLTLILIPKAKVLFIVKQKWQRGRERES